jgi:HSP20 family protein
MGKLPDELISFPFQLPREVERLFDQLIHRPWGSGREPGGWNPSVDLYETPQAVVLEADLPGVKAQDIEIDVTDGDLFLRGSRSFQKEHEHGRFYALERSSGQFVRRMKLPARVQKNAMKVEFHDGVLRVILPKAHQKGEAV